MKSEIKNIQVNYSAIKNKFFANKIQKKDTDPAELSHFLQKNSEVNLKSTNLKKILNGNAKEILSEPIFQKKLDIVWDVPFPPPANPDFTFIDLFAGIGGFRIALQNQNGKCVFSSEINNAARETYEANFGEYPYGDIRKFTGPQISNEELDKLIPDHTILTGGFPCQPFSLAGVSARNFLGQVHGFSDITKGNLFFDIARIVQVKQPKFIFLENVKNFKNHDDGNTYNTVKNTLEDLGYHFYSDIINAQTWVPQQRQRFYMVCIKRKKADEPRPVFEFPKPEGEPKILASVLEDNVIDYTISDRLWQGHINRTKRNIERGTGFTANVADLDKPSKTLVARYGKDGKECLIPQEGMNPRKLTPRECARLQGFPERFILPPSNAPAYHQFGNSVAVPVIDAIAEQIIKHIKKKIKK